MLLHGYESGIIGSAASDNAGQLPAGDASDDGTEDADGA